MVAAARLPARRSLIPAFLLAAVLAGCTGQGDAAVEVPDTDADIAVVGTDTLRWEPMELRAEAGEISLSLTCQDGVNHNFVIDEVGEIAECARGQTVEASFELEAGSYEYVCTIPGHDRTMRGQLTVE
jgi:plastocyanin